MGVAVTSRAELGRGPAANAAHLPAGGQLFDQTFHLGVRCA